MAHVIIGKCLGERYGACVDVCPVEAMHYGMHEGACMMVIHPETCIDCGACVPECPTEAIFLDEDVPPKWDKYIKLNEELAAAWPVISEQKDPIDDADDWKDVEDKFEHLSRAAGPGDD